MMLVALSLFAWLSLFVWGLGGQSGGGGGGGLAEGCSSKVGDPGTHLLCKLVTLETSHCHVFPKRRRRKKICDFRGREMEVLVGVGGVGSQRVGHAGRVRLFIAKGWVWGIDIGIDQPYADTVTTGQR